MWMPCVEAGVCKNEFLWLLQNILLLNLYLDDAMAKTMTKLNKKSLILTSFSFVIFINYSTS